MIGTIQPSPLFNPVTAPADQLVTGWEILSGPYGLAAFLPLVPLLRLLAVRTPRTALIVFGLVWLVGTTGPAAAGILVAGCLVAAGWVLLLARGVTSGWLGRRAMIGLVWLGLAALLSPLWWYAQWSWYGWGEPSRLAVLHNLGFAYFFLRFVAWGVRLAQEPDQALRPIETLCWILYPPCMRLGPVLLRRDFLERFDAWRPAEAVPWREVGRRFGGFLLGCVGIGLAGVTLNWGEKSLVPPGSADFFAAPELYSTPALWRVFYLVPIQIYLLLWTYNELAAALGLWVGIRVDDNFDFLPRAKSVREFWRRWHLTVARWLREYVYFPLGGNRGGLRLVNQAAVFAFCGLWHGASWSFLLWGASQVVALVVQRWWDALKQRAGWGEKLQGWWWSALCWVLTMNYQVATIVVFADFEHYGWRLFVEMAKRMGFE